MSKKRKIGPSLGLKREQDPALRPIAERKKALAAELKKKKKEDPKK